MITLRGIAQRVKYKIPNFISNLWQGIGFLLYQQLILGKNSSWGILIPAFITWATHTLIVLGKKMYRSIELIEPLTGFIICFYSLMKVFLLKINNKKKTFYFIIRSAEKGWKRKRMGANHGIGKRSVWPRTWWSAFLSPLFAVSLHGLTI